MRGSGYFLTVIILLFFFSCTREEQTKSSRTPTEKNSLSDEFNHIINRVNNIDSLYYLTDKYERELIKKKASPQTLARFYQKAAGKFYVRSKYEISKEYFQKSEQAYQKAGDTLMTIKMRGNQAVLLDLQGHYQEAVKIFLDIAAYFKKNNDTLPLAYAYSNIGVIYEELKNPEKAIAYGKKALELKRKAGDTLHMASNLNNIGVNYDELLNNPDSAIYYYQQAFIIYKKFNKVDNYATVLNNLGRMYLEKEEYQKAAASFNEAFQIFDSLEMVNDKAAVLRNQGELLFYQGKINPALDKMQQAYKLYKESGASQGLLETTGLLSKIYMAEGNYGNAANMLQQYNNLKDTLLNTETRTIIAEMETKYQVKEKNNIIRMLQLQDQLHTKQIRIQTLFITFLIIVFLLSAVLYFSHHKRTTLKQQKLRLELQNYLLRMNEMQNKLENQKEDCGKHSGMEQLEKFNLSKQEMKVISLIAEGYKNAEIAEKLFISQNTVKTHIKNIYSKLDVKNRVEALKKVNAS
jgi:ATP/maltotriose-dependent transcriptional regulator MalT